MSVGAAGFIVLLHMHTTTVNESHEAQKHMHTTTVNATKHIALHNRGVATPKLIKGCCLRHYASPQMVAALLAAT